MKPLTITETADHIEFAWRAALVILANFLMGLLIGAFVSDREVCDE